MANFKKALGLTIDEMFAAHDEGDMCLAVYPDEICEDNAMIMVMEYACYPTLHAFMQDLHDRLSEKMGHPVSICHNDPTDENILIHGHSDDASVYYGDECCKRSTIECYERWVAAGRSEAQFRPELRAIFKGAECIADGLDKTPLYVLNTLNWNEHPQAQIIQLLLDYHN